MKVYTAVVFILAGLFSIHFYYRNKFSKSGILLLIVMLMPVLNSCKSTDEQPIKVGILHSLTGTMAISEKAVVDGSLLAIEEINQLGGINGQKILPLVVDGKSDLQTFEQEAERLITKEKVSVVFGCWTSASRKTVLSVFEKHNHLLFYPVQYEGLEQSPNIIYNGAAPNQQIIPAVKWCFDNLGKRFFLVGSDYVFPHTANEIIKQQANLLGAKIVGEDYILLGSSDVIYIGSSKNLRRRTANYTGRVIKNKRIAESLHNDNVCIRYYATNDYIKLEKDLLKNFKKHYGQLPKCNIIGDI